MKKINKTTGGLPKFKVFGSPLKVALGSHLGEVLGRFWAPSWRQVEPCWALSWLKMATQHDTKKTMFKNVQGKAAEVLTGPSVPP